MKKTYLISFFVTTLFIFSILYFLFFNNSNDIELVLSSGQSGGVYKPIAESIATAVNSEYSGIKIKVIESPGSIENIKRLENRKADLAMVQNDAPGNSSIRTIVPMYQEALHFLVRKDSGINRFTDIKGHAIAVGPRQSGTERVVRNLLKHYGMSYNDVKPEFLPVSEAGVKMIDDKISAVFFISGIKSIACENILSSGTIRFAGLGDLLSVGSEAEGFCLEYPFASPYVIPVNCYSAGSRSGRGEPEKPISTIAFRSVLVTRHDVEEDVIQEVTRAIFNHRTNIIKKHKVAAQITEAFDASILQYPVHPGARSYYDRDKPGFFVTYAESMGLILSVLIALCGLIIAFRQWLARMKKDRIDVYYSKLDNILSQLNHDKTGEKALKKIEKELHKVYHEAFIDLVDEKLAADESFSILQSLFLDCQLQVQNKLKDKKEK